MRSTFVKLRYILPDIRPQRGDLQNHQLEQACLSSEKYTMGQMRVLDCLKGHVLLAGQKHSLQTGHEKHSLQTKPRSFISSFAQLSENELIQLRYTESYLKHFFHILKSFLHYVPMNPF